MRSITSALLLLAFMISWWIVWLTLSVVGITNLYPPSLETLSQFGLLIFSMSLGFLSSLVINYKKNILNNHTRLSTPLNQGFIRVSNFILLAILILLLLSLYLSGFYTSSFVEYNIFVRTFGYGDYLTGSKIIDLITKVLIYPLIVSYSLVYFSINERSINKYLVFSTAILYSLLWQVNYPIIFLFWLSVLRVLYVNEKQIFRNLKPVFYISLIAGGLLLAATIRYGTGEFSKGVIEHYVINYHIIGFSFYDQHVLNHNSLLYEHSFGRSSAGFFEQILDLILRPLQLNWSAASFENRDYNMTPLMIGSNFEGNAFGTLLFTFYRDFSYMGVVLGGLLFGYFTCKAYLKSVINWRFMALLLLLLYSWFTGMMVSPIEQGYFWFSVVFLLVISRFKVGNNE